MMNITKDKKNNQIIYTAPCRVTGKNYTVTVPMDGFIQWQNGELIQRAMPNVSDEDREFLISHTSPEGWDQTIGKL